MLYVLTTFICEPNAIVVYLGFTMLLISQVISIAFYSEREKSNRFCSEALISAWGSFTCCKSTTRDPWLYNPSRNKSYSGFLRSDKIHWPPAGFEPTNLGSRGEYLNHRTTGVNPDAVNQVYEVSAALSPPPFLLYTFPGFSNYITTVTTI